ncbi:hypothetical protein SNE40_019160 [Patella caerulea]|uniref:Uncharacterized protein n=1 Tax=Patella caerulea TaxID=87958 RepID=A0AAN8J649_PATCE
MPKAGSRLNTRIQEFELWRKDGDFFKEGEYAKRRNQRRERVNVIESDRRLKRWKKLYIPAVLGMMTGSFLTLASTVHGLGKNTIFWTSKEVFHVIGPVFLVTGLFFLMIAAAFSHREEEKLRIKLGLPSMFPQSIKTLPSEENTSITTVSEMESSHSISDRLASKPRDKKCVRYNWSELSTDSTEAASFVDGNSSFNTPLDNDREKNSRELKQMINYSKNTLPQTRRNKRRSLKRNISFQSDVYSIASDMVFDHENEITRKGFGPLKETDIDAYCAMEETRCKYNENRSAMNKCDSLPNMVEHDKQTCTLNPIKQDDVESNEPLMGCQSSKQIQLKSKNSNGTTQETDCGISNGKRERSRVFCFHKLVKDRFVSSASETSSGYSSGTNMVDTEPFECFTSFDSEPEGDVIGLC